MRILILSKHAKKDINQFKGREKFWIDKTLDFIVDERNTQTIISQKFKSLSGELSGFRKAKHRGFGIRIVFRFLSDNEIEIMIDKDDEEYREMIELLAVGKRELVYEIAKHRLKGK